MSDDKEVSPQKLAANRANAKRSTGPKTLAGKDKASQNAYKHGFHSKHLFPNEKLRTQDGADFEMLYNGLREYYSPQGFAEHSLVEQLAKEYLRRARVERIEQETVAKSGMGAYMHASLIPNILRCETAASHEIRRLTERLETLRERRFAEEEAELESEQGEDGDAAGAPAVTCLEPPTGAAH